RSQSRAQRMREGIWRAINQESGERRKDLFPAGSGLIKVHERGSCLADSAFFISGSLFTTDYLVEAIKDDPAYCGVDAAALRETLVNIAAAFPQSDRTNESQTEDDFIWPVLGAVGWRESLRQQNLTISGRDDVPDGLLFADAQAKVAANELDEQ